jgi:hypothetical protein
MVKEILTLSKGKIVCVDIDNVVADVNAQLALKGYDISVYPNPELTYDFWRTYEGLDILYKARKIQSTCEILQALDNAGAEIYFATGRDFALKELTESWLQNNGIWNGDEVYFSTSKHFLDADIYIEDDPFQIARIISTQKPVIIPEWEYNKDFADFSNVYYYKL